MHDTGELRPGQPSTAGNQRMEGVSVLVLDSEKALAEALAAALQVQESMSSALAASDPEAAVSAADEHDVDVVVVGTDSEGWGSLAFLREMGRRRPDVALVAMSGDDDPDHVAAALIAGAVSWIPKQVSVRELTAVVLGAARGESSIPPRVLWQVLRRLARDSTPTQRASVFTPLTGREREVLEYVVLGFRRGEIANELGLSVNTVRTHVQHILSKLRVRTTLEAVTLVLQEQAPN